MEQATWKRNLDTGTRAEQDRENRGLQPPSDGHFNATEMECVMTRAGEKLDAVVHAWWTAWESKDLAAIRDLALPEYLEFTGHSRFHRLGRDTLCEVAKLAFATTSTMAWELGPRVDRFYGDSVVAAYSWESVVEKDWAVEIMRGVATDVLIEVDGSWRYAAHHSSAF